MRYEMKPSLLNVTFIIVGLGALIGSIPYYMANQTFIALLPFFIGIILILYGIFASKL
jgi:hypothetical protein